LRDCGYLLHPRCGRAPRPRPSTAITSKTRANRPPGERRQERLRQLAEADPAASAIAVPPPPGLLGEGLDQGQRREER
jgi:hypothetical protein